MGLIDDQGNPINPTNWKDLGVHSKLSLLRSGLGEIMRMQIAIMKHLGMKVGIGGEDGEDSGQSGEQPEPGSSRAETEGGISVEAGHRDAKDGDQGSSGGDSDSDKGSGKTS